MKSYVSRDENLVKTRTKTLTSLLWRIIGKENVIHCIRRQLMCSGGKNICESNTLENMKGNKKRKIVGSKNRKNDSPL